MSIQIAKIYGEIAKKAPEFALKYWPMVVDAGKDGMTIAKNVLEVINLNSDIMVKQKQIKDCYEKIGKLVYEKKNATSNANIKSEIGKIDNYNKDIEKNKKKIAEIEKENKKSKIISDAKNLLKGIEIGKKTTTKKAKKTGKKK